MNERIKQILVILAVVAIVIIFTYIIDFEYVVEMIRIANKPHLFVSMLTMIAGFVMVSVRLRIIFGGQISFRQTFFGDALGFMTTPFLPLPTPVLRAIGIERTTPLNTSLVSPALAVDYLLGMVMRVLALIFVIFLIPSAVDSSWSVVGSILLIIALFGGLIWLVNHLEQTFDAVARWLSLMPRVEEERVRNTLTEVQTALEAASSTRSLLVSLLYTVIITFCFVLYHYFAWVALPLDLTWRQMLSLSMAVLVVVPPTAPLMIGAYQGVLVGALALLRILDVNVLTAYAILLQMMQIIFWVIIGSFALSRTRIRLGELIQHADKKEDM